MLLEQIGVQFSKEKNEKFDVSKETGPAETYGLALGLRSGFSTEQISKNDRESIFLTPYQKPDFNHPLDRIDLGENFRLVLSRPLYDQNSTELNKTLV